MIHGLSCKEYGRKEMEWEEVTHKIWTKIYDLYHSYRSPYSSFKTDKYSDWYLVISAETKYSTSEKAIHNTIPEVWI